MDFSIKVCMGLLAVLMMAIWMEKPAEKNTHPLISIFVGFIVGSVALIIVSP